jgi:hypothetical protein
MRVHLKFAAVASAALMLSLTACAAEVSSDDEGDPAAAVVAMGDTGISTITLSELGATRLGIETQPVEEAPSGNALVVPYDAVIYDAEGVTWVFTNPSGRTYVRAPIEIARVSGDDAVLSSGPTVGTAVVTVGAAELVGAEAGLGA